jgi:uncharacterized protein (TIGR01319 family)
LSNYDLENMNFILATDVGSTTTKARFFKKISGEYRYVISGEAPTTVEAPYEDVTMGASNCIREVEELTGHELLDENNKIITPGREGRGVDLYVTTSSAGGGLQMMCAGVIREMTAESAERAALGAGAIVMDVVAIDDGRKIHEKISRIRDLRPDMMLIAGGTDGGTVKHVAGQVDLIVAAEPKARLGISYDLPVVYAGNVDVRDYVKERMEEKFALDIVDNIRPTLAVEKVEPARNAIHELFMEHVMSHAPGYNNLMKWTDVPIMPTPAGEGMMVQLIAETYDTDTLGVGLGGATTNIYSVIEKRFVRSVSANLGMSYSICNVMKESGMKNIMRWVPFDIESRAVRNRLRNKMIRPTTIPQTIEDLMIEHAVAREALRLGLIHHRSIARGLKGYYKQMDISDLYHETDEEVGVKMMDIKIICGTGGLLSHAPRRIQTMIILSDGFQTEGITMLCQDSVFMMPHLGVLSTVHKDAAWQIFDKDCLVRLGSVIAPVGSIDEGERAISVTLNLPDGSSVKEDLAFGSMKRIPLGERMIAKAVIEPSRNLDVGEGPGRNLETEVEGGIGGIVIDARGRPLVLPEESDKRKAKLLEWFTALNMYPSSILNQFR